jgi:hemolysin-activating ACP:hemolysin acyltransferase
MQAAHNIETASASAGSPGLKLVQHKNPFVALGLAVNHLMGRPAFANLRFGDWSRVLVGQINRRHYYFAIDETNQVQGFVGWALTTRDKAESWVAGRSALTYEDSQDGDCLIINAWAASSPEVGRLLRDAARRVGEGKHAVYFKRHYKDGTIRPMRLDINAFVEQHLKRKAESVG